MRKEKCSSVGRPPLGGRQHTIILPEDLVYEMERIAHDLHVDRAKIHRSLLCYGLDVFYFYEKLGIVELGEISKRNKKRNRVQERLFVVPV